MREIKFRAWDSFQKKYVFEGFNVIGEITCFDGIGQIIQETWKERSEKQRYETSLLAFNDFELEQYTGLRDKNRREIYEGDIVKIVTENGFLNHWMAIGEKYVVEYEKYGFSPFTEYDSDCCQYLMPEWCEVIGNIHENPELLK